MRIAIVNDMKMAVHVLTRLVQKYTTHNIAWVAYDGEEAVKKCAEDTPDIILMDLIMPRMGGVEATRRIMKENPCAILIVTSSVNGNLSKVFEAMGQGALDVVKTPSLDLNGSPDDTELLGKIDNIGLLLGYKERRRQHLGHYSKPAVKEDSQRNGYLPLLVIGASTGGPKALAKVLSQFPVTIPFATIVVQHVDQEFAPGLAEWLGGQTPLAVELITHGVYPVAGRVYLAEKNQHIIVSKEGCLEYTNSPEGIPYCPSANVLFSSIAKCWPRRGVAALLTGMGDDGATGLKELFMSGWYTIAESEKTCVVYGMPKVAVQLGAASVVLPVYEIAHAILNKFSTNAVIASMGE